MLNTYILSRNGKDEFKGRNESDMRKKFTSHVTYKIVNGRNESLGRGWVM